MTAVRIEVQIEWYQLMNALDALLPTNKAQARAFCKQDCDNLRGAANLIESYLKELKER